MKGVDADYAYYQKQFVMVLLLKTIKKLKSWILYTIVSKIQLPWRCHVRIGKHVCCERKTGFGFENIWSFNFWI
jgi:hypothetical protein